MNEHELSPCNTSSNGPKWHNEAALFTQTSDNSVFRQTATTAAPATEKARARTCQGNAISVEKRSLTPARADASDLPGCRAT